MKTTYRKSKSSKGFTLVELLVVIAIIAVLAAISGPIALRVYSNSLDTKATAQMKQFVVGANDFAKDHGSITYGALTTGTGVDDGIFDTDATAVEAYLALLSGKGTVENISGKNYIKLAKAEGDAGEERGGLIFNATGVPTAFVDPWGAGYKLAIDFSYDQVINDSGLGDFKDQNIGLNGSKVLMVSFGRDKAAEGGNDLKSN